MMLDENSSTIHDLLKARAEQDGGAVAIVSPGRTPLTYQHLLCHVERAVESLRLSGIRCHDRIAIVLPAGPELATAFLAVAGAAAAIPLNPAYREQEFDAYFADFRPKALLTATDGAATRAARKRGVDVIHVESRLDAPAGVFTVNNSRHASDEVGRDSGCDDTALLLSTSGTTSRPKLVPLTHKNLLSAAANIAVSLKLDATDRCLDVMPLFHIHGLVGGLLSSLTASASVAIPPAFDSCSFFAWLEELKPTWYTAVPTMHQAISRSAAARDGKVGHHSLRFIRSCSAALSPKLMAETEALFGVPVIEAYGMTEASHQIASNPLPPLERKAGSVGRPTRTQVAILDESGNLKPPGEIGEVVVRGENLTTGYEGDSDANRGAFTNGWFRTGDRGYFDSEGYLFLTGRIKELINRGGVKLAPLEIETVLLDHPDLSDAVVFPLSHSTLGEDVAAAAVLKPGRAVTETELQQFVALRLADFKIPRRIAFVDEIPKGATGKVQRRQLASQLGLDFGTSNLPERSVEKRTVLEAEVASIWCAVLQHQRISIHDSFFSLGGDSLTAAEVVSRLSQRLGAELSLFSFIETPTVAEMAAKLDADQVASRGWERRAPARKEARKNAPTSSLVELRRGEIGKPIFVFPGGGGGDDEFFYFMRLLRHMPADYQVYGFRARGADGVTEPHSSVDEMLKDYIAEMRTLQLEGPYFLIGDCIGGVVACEAARLLKMQGQEIATLILLDSERPTKLKYYAYRLDALRNGIVHAISYHWKGVSKKARQLLQATSGSGDLPVQREQGKSSKTAADSNERLEVVNPHERINASGEVHRRNLRRHKPKPYDGDIKLVVNTEWFQRNQTLGWADIASGSVESYAAPGDHLTYTSKHAEEVAKQITRWIAGARGDRTEGRYVDAPPPAESELPLFWRKLLTNASVDLAEVIPAGDRFILVDEGQWGDNFLKDRLAIPFLEHDGQYVGCPPDDETAIKELMRLHKTGANFIVFGWPAFWWLNYYAGLRNFLQKESSCVLRNDCLVAFDLR